MWCVNHAPTLHCLVLIQELTESGSQVPTMIMLMLSSRNLACCYFFTDSLAGKVVWITGASNGIGEHMALAMARAGVKLVLSARREHELERVKKNCVREYSTHCAGVTNSRDPLSPVFSCSWWLVLGLGGGF